MADFVLEIIRSNNSLLHEIAEKEREEFQVNGAFSGSAYLQALHVRVQALFSSVIISATIVCLGTFSLTYANVQTLVEFGPNIFQLIKVNLLYLKVVVLGTATVLLSIVVPEFPFFLTDICHKISSSVAELDLNLMKNLEVYAYRKMSFDVSRLMEANVRLANFRQELPHFITSAPHTDHTHEFTESFDMFGGSRMSHVYYGGNNPYFWVFVLLLSPWIRFGDKYMNAADNTSAINRNAFRNYLLAHYTEEEIDEVDHLRIELPEAEIEDDISRAQRLSSQEVQPQNTGPAKKEFAYLLAKTMKSTRQELLKAKVYDSDTIEQMMESSLQAMLEVSILRLLQTQLKLYEGTTLFNSFVWTWHDEKGAHRLKLDSQNDLTFATRDSPLEPSLFDKLSELFALLQDINEEEMVTLQKLLYHKEQNPNIPQKLQGIYNAFGSIHCDIESRVMNSLGMGRDYPNFSDCFHE